MFADFYHAFYYSLLIGASSCCLFLFNKVDKPFRYLAVLILLTLLSELTAKYISFVLHKPNNVVYHVFTPMEFFFYAVIYKQFFNSNKWNHITLWCVVIVIVAEFLNSVFFQPLEETNTNIFMLESVLLVLFSLSLFVKIRRSDYYENLLKEGVF